MHKKDPGKTLKKLNIFAGISTNVHIKPSHERRVEDIQTPN
jgi:hypothetical protein